MNATKARIKCGNCREFHESVAEVKACYGSVVPPTAPQPKVQEVPEWAKHPATERQVSYLLSLANSRDWSSRLGESQADSDISETVMNVLDGKTIGKAEASAAIERLKDLPQSASTKDDNAWPSVPEGRYALESAEDGVRFYKVDKPTEGKWAGYVFVRQLVGSPGSWTEYRQRGAQATAILNAIHEMGARESAVLFGMKARHCGRCMSPLSNVRSRAAGYGETCAGLLGWPYPSKREALRILRERGESTEESHEPDMDGVIVGDEPEWTL